MTDPLTIAYLALGAKNTITRRHGAPPDFNGGELELIADVIAEHVWLEEQYRDLFGEGGWNGVWVYDVVEPMGEWFAEQHYTRSREVTRDAFFDSLIRRYG